MNATHTAAWLLALALPAAGCVAASRMGQALVTEEQGQPCFATDAPGAMARLQAIVVSDVSVPPAATLWASPVEVSAAASGLDGACIPYGPDAAARFQTDAPVHALRPGRIYHVFLNVWRADAGDATHGYQAEFCLTGRSGGVHQIRWDARLGGRSTLACGPIR